MINLVTNKNILWLEQNKKSAVFIKQQHPSHYIHSSYLQKDMFNVVLTQQPIDMYECVFKEAVLAYHLIRPELNTCSKNLVTNGFSVFKKHQNKYKYMIPLLTEPFHNNVIHPEEICIGFYYQLYKHNRDVYLNYLQNIPPIKVAYMGPSISPVLLPKKHRYIHIESNVLFYNTITHYLYTALEDFVDPWPTTLEEAIAYNKQIVIITPKQRTFQDGVDDILTCIQYHKNTTKIFDCIFDNSNCLLNTFNHSLFYNELLNVKWNVHILYNTQKFNTIQDFLKLFQL